jgi:hypothetical protein
MSREAAVAGRGAGRVAAGAAIRRPAETTIAARDRARVAAAIIARGGRQCSDGGERGRETAG